jgi:hypothetical protein
MSDGPRYRVTGAVLTKRPNGVVWTLTFTPEPAPQDTPEAEGTSEIVITLPPAEVDNMLFDTAYTKDEITALASGHSPM